MTTPRETFDAKTLRVVAMRDLLEQGAIYFVTDVATMCVQLLTLDQVFTRREDTMFNLEKPIFHLGGTDCRNIAEGLCAAHLAVKTADGVLAQASPHPRDYLINGPGAYEKAQAQHLYRLHRLLCVEEELRALFDHARLAVGEKEERRRQANAELSEIERDQERHPEQ